jgi:phosphoglucomutase
MLVSVAAEYNNALLVVENANIGWDVINTIIEKGYQNLHYSPTIHGDISADKWISKMEAEQTVPGFTTSVKTRPLVISKMESYIRDKHFIFHSKRLLEELRVFIWINGKAQAQNGYNDDLVMALGMGLFTRDTGVKYHMQGLDSARAALAGISSTGGGASLGPIMPNGTPNPYQMETQYGVEDMTWLLG